MSLSVFYCSRTKQQDACIDSQRKQNRIIFRAHLTLTLHEGHVEDSQQSSRLLNGRPRIDSRWKNCDIFPDSTSSMAGHRHLIFHLLASISGIEKWSFTYKSLHVFSEIVIKLELLAFLRSGECRFKRKHYLRALYKTCLTFACCLIALAEELFKRACTSTKTFK